MKFTAIITHANGNQERKNIIAEDAKTAHATARKTTIKSDTVRVYIDTQPDGRPDANSIQYASLMVVKRTTANMIKREAGNLQFKLYNECRKSVIDDTDTLDCLQVASLAFIQAISDGLTIEEQYHTAYLCLNKYLRDNKQINLSVTAQRTIYINDIDGDIINITGNIGKILKHGERYTPCEYANDDPEKIKKQLEIINSIAVALTPVQLTVLKHLARGYSVRQIASDMHRAPSTIQEHINLIRKKATQLYPDGYRVLVAE